MNKNKIWTVFYTILAFVTTAAYSVMANEPVEGGLNLQPAVTSSARDINALHDLLLWIIVPITIFVFLLLVWVVIRYNKKANPTPSNVTHNVPLEILWTVLPVVILIVIAVPSFKLLYKNDRIINPEMTLKITGYQWYWGYEYPDHGGIEFNSIMIPEDEITGDQRRLLSTDNPVVVPIDTDIAILVTANDVIHSWAMPAFGMKMDAVPGRINETWFNVSKPGVYYGQCSEICGKDHAYMPIEVHAVSKEEFKAWVEKAKEEFAENDVIEGDVMPIKLTALSE